VSVIVTSLLLELPIVVEVTVPVSDATVRLERDGHQSVA
jgi:hypothetical protein